MRSIVCYPQFVAVWNHFDEMYVINPKERNIQSICLNDIPFAQQTDYILAHARLHTNPLDWIKIKDYRSSPLFFGAPKGTRTPDLPLRRRLLYPAELLKLS